MLGPHITDSYNKRERAGPFAFGNWEVIGNLHQLVSVGRKQSPSVGEKQGGRGCGKYGVGVGKTSGAAVEGKLKIGGKRVYLKI